jgi:hypothetical protein
MSIFPLSLIYASGSQRLAINKRKNFLETDWLQIILRSRTFGVGVLEDAKRRLACSY